ncbi:MAG: single-stranded DNA-binding protein [Bacteroidetes bacterium]|nr:single-stranded DNA-binding protein [Bacteroidota bacterium]
MEILIGRLTADARVNKTKDERQVVDFTIAINDRFKTKGSSELKKVTTYVNCSYWISVGIAPYLKKGVLVELFGRIHVSAWKKMDGEPVASLNLHVSNIKLHGKSTSTAEKEKQAVTAISNPEIAATEDLPF